MKSLILLLIAMSAAGTFPFIIYIALSTIFDNYISARFRYRCLKYCLLLYLVPFPVKEITTFPFKGFGVLKYR